MSESTKFSPEVRERAARMVQENQRDYPLLWATAESIAHPGSASCRRRC